MAMASPDSLLMVRVVRRRSNSQWVVITALNCRRTYFLHVACVALPSDVGKNTRLELLKNHVLAHVQDF